MRYLLKKEKGSHGTIDFVPVLLVIVFGAYILINCGMKIKYLDTVNKIENLSQKYIMRMSTTKGLTDQDTNSFYDDMQKLGIISSDINLNGTTFHRDNINYGDEVYLVINVKIPYYNLSIHDNFDRHTTTVKKNVSINKCMVALA